MAIFNNDEVNRLILALVEWAEKQRDIAGIAMVGSYARGNPQPDSDIDFLILAADKNSYRANSDWLNEINWQAIAANIEKWHDQDYGAVWSRHIFLSGEHEIEIGFADQSWAEFALTDEASANVVKNGFRVLYDPQKLLQKMLDKI